MKLSEHKNLKAEILALPPKEKDKLLLRLVAKDKVLTERLHFLLLEDEINLKERVATLKDEIEQVAHNLRELKGESSKDVLLNMRKILKSINHFYKVTKADFEEIELRIFLFTLMPTSGRVRSFSLAKNYDQLLAIFFVKSIIATLKKFQRLHEDLQFDLQESVNKLLSKIYNTVPDIAVDLGLPKQI
ncbi:hypothetical protein [Pedobacter insulae]|uniref:Uncharacterized protein n=1 Tax=Pedobacter insulae TaxID=414048 RepID=A0A1I2TVL1_9SPHI|nr:hypothetical protein [Pedobacter insulae]SFG67427.1 hypothetical protein SAMN04489864_101548 [Pedobacter insulae]